MASKPWLKDAKRIVWHSYLDDGTSEIVLGPEPVGLVALEPDGYISDDVGVPDSDIYFLVSFRPRPRARSYRGIITKTADHWAQIAGTSKRGQPRNRVIISNDDFRLTAGDREKIRAAVNKFVTALNP